MLRRSFERLGPTFIKFGQILALQPHLIQARYCEALFRLLDQCPAEPLDSVRKVILEDFGREPEEIFRHFDWKPLASASFGQVHRARLPTGEAVAVKVQRRSVARKVTRDVRVFRFLARLSDWMGISGSVKLSPAVDEFEKWTNEELDYTVEGSYAEQLTPGGDRSIRKIPTVHWDYTTKRVLTTEFLEGIPLSRLLERARDDSSNLQRDLAGLRVDNTRLVEHLIDNYLEDTMIRGVFQADPHPGNIIVMDGGRIGYVDFGIMGHLTKDHRRIIARYLAAGARGDGEGVTASFMELASGGDPVSREEFRKALLAIVDRWLLAAGSVDRPPSQRSFSRLSLAFIGLLRKHQMTIPPDTLAFYRTVNTIDSITLELSPDSDTMEIGRRFFMRRQVPGLSDSDLGALLREASERYFQLWLEFPVHLQQILRAAAEIRGDEVGRPPSVVASPSTGLVLPLLVAVGLLWVGLDAEPVLLERIRWFSFGLLAVTLVYLVSRLPFFVPYSGRGSGP